jgi:hypothetical protein
VIYHFHSKAGPDVIMLSDLSERIFSVLGKPLEQRGILTATQLPDLISLLEGAIVQDQEQRQSQGSPQSSLQSLGNNLSSPVAKGDPLGRRAFPFLELMKQAAAAQEPIVWNL